MAVSLNQPVADFTVQATSGLEVSLSALKGKQVVFALGYSHPIVFDIPNGIDITVDKQTHITVSGADRWRC